MKAKIVKNINVFLGQIFWMVKILKVFNRVFS